MSPQDGYVVLTNYRIIWISTSSTSSSTSSTSGGNGSDSGQVGGVPCHLPLQAVAQAEHKPGRLINYARIKLHVRQDSASYPTPGELVVCILGGNSLPTCRKLCALSPCHPPTGPCCCTL